MTTMAQLNVRMKPELKAAGDSVLELYGISPTDIIRTLWEKISLGEEALDQVAMVFAQDPAVGSTSVGMSRTNSMGFSSMVRRRQADFEREMGLEPTTYVPLDDAELNDLVYEDYLEEWRRSHAD